MTIIKNTKYDNIGCISGTDRNLLSKTNLYDTVIYNNYGSVKEGQVTFISKRGINITTYWGDRFIKWCHVIEIRKSE